jgi:hypothetical protein
MDGEIGFIVAIAGHYNATDRRGGWGVCIRGDGEDIEMFGSIRRTSGENCELEAFDQAVLTLRNRRLNVVALEVSRGVKRRLVHAPRGAESLDRWRRARKWWNTQIGIGLRVARREGDAYAVAARNAEVAAITGNQRPRSINAPVLQNRAAASTSATSRVRRDPSPSRGGSSDEMLEECPGRHREPEGPHNSIDLRPPELRDVARTANPSAADAAHGDDDPATLEDLLAELQDASGGQRAQGAGT